ncbi:tetratricopeptide repeat protein [Sphingosinicellaceae bacterium]|nr:tetratricopeptide repeat protein [Sphingosinicellaceae bacterium]
MALPGETDDSFIREVDEEYRRAQLTTLWSRWGRWLVIGVLVLLAALGGFLWWRAEQVRSAGVDGEDFSRAQAKLETGNTPEAAPILDRLAATSGGYAVLAKLAQASNAIQAGDTAKATVLYDAIAADTKQPPPFRELALVRSTRLNFDALPPATVIARLKDLSVPGNPWFGVAGEMTAIAHLKAGQPALAGTLLANIANDAKLPPTLRGRAQQLAGSLGADIKPPVGTVTPATAATQQGAR